MLPGIGQRIVKPNYRKCQTLSFSDGVPVSVLVGKGLHDPPPDEAADYDLHRFRPPHLVPSRSFCFDGASEHLEREFIGSAPPVSFKGPLLKPFVPKTVFYDKMTLRFDGYYVEESFAWGFGRRAIHPIKLCYFLEDDTISVHEPVTQNSGRPQGKLVVRHKALKSAPGPQNDQVGSASMDPPPPLPSYWHWKDLNVSSDVTIFGRCYRLIDCNSWTREFLTSAGIQVNAPEELPEPKQLPGAASLRAQSAPHRQPRDHPLKKFLQHDGQILRFGCVWDRRNETGIGPDERLKPYVLRYYLVDDTVQISDAEFEVNQRRGLYGSSRAQEAILLRRQKLPKEPRPILTSPADTEDIVYYQPEDLLLGNVISVHGRRFILVETGDDFTRSFYRNMDIVDFSPIDISSL